MKNILCYGDSNTYGSNPLGGRWPWEVRWPGQLQRLLGEGYHIIEEGLGGRTTVWEDGLAYGRNGRQMLPVALDSHSPLDLVVLMLGTNDFKQRFALSAADIALGAGQLVKLVQHHLYAQDFAPPQVLLVSPIHITPGIEQQEAFGIPADAPARSQMLAQHMQAQAKQLGCLFFDAATVAGPSPVDHLHLEADGHTALAAALAQIIQTR